MVATIPPLSFETTLCTLGSNVFMQIILLYYVKKMPCAGISTLSILPELNDDCGKWEILRRRQAVLSRALTGHARWHYWLDSHLRGQGHQSNGANVRSIYFSELDKYIIFSGYHARTVEEFGRFASLATLLFGGTNIFVFRKPTNNSFRRFLSHRRGKCFEQDLRICLLLVVVTPVLESATDSSFRFIQLAVVVLAVLVTLGNFSLLLDGWISYIYMMLPTIGFFFIVIALLIVSN